MFSHEPRCIYRRNQLSDVICQLRFPEIVQIQQQHPDAFLQQIRQEFPNFSLRKDMPARPLPGSAPVQQKGPIHNYQFTSEDGHWRVNLTSGFISVSCGNYTCWEDFARKLDLPLASFIRLYRPERFQRIGLRYINFISRKALDLEEVSFCELMNPCYLGILKEADIAGCTTTRSTVDAELKLSGGCHAKLHAGPGKVHRMGQPDPEVKFIFDQDIFLIGDLPVNTTASSLETLHRQSFPIFRGAITPLLHNAMEPTKI